MARVFKRHGLHLIHTIAIYFLVSFTYSYAEDHAAGEGKPTISVGDIQFIPCELAISGRSRQAECATYTVPENWHDSKSRTIELAIARIPARRQNERKADPVIFLAGGPGQAASQAFLFADTLYPDLIRNRDFYLIDQRGTGNSSRLECDAFSRLQEMTGSDVGNGQIVRATKACVKSLDADLRGYTTAASARDLDSIRSKLDLDAWNVFGVSYGTRLAYYYARMFPDSVRTLILDSVLPPNHTLGSEVALRSHNALNALIEDCKTTAACSQHYAELLTRFHKRLENAKYLDREIEFESIQTGVLDVTTLHYHQILSYIRFGLYAAETRAVLLAVLNQALIYDNYAPLVRAGLIQHENIQGSISTVLHFAVTCIEDYPKLKSLYASGELNNHTYLGDSTHQIMLAVCENWVEIDYQDAKISSEILNVPTLMLVGELDPITPQEYAHEMQQYLPNSRMLVLNGRGHSVAHYGCAPILMAQFVDQASHSNIDSTCLDRLQDLPIFLNLNGFEP